MDWKPLCPACFAAPPIFPPGGERRSAASRNCSTSGRPDVARKLRDAGCFSGPLLTRPDRIPRVYPRNRYDGSVHVGRDGPLRWHDHSLTDDDMVRLTYELDQGPLIMEADFVTTTPEFNQHFFVAEAFTHDAQDQLISDPWDGTCTRLLEPYAEDHWDLRRAIYGVRLLRVDQ